MDDIIGEQAVLIERMKNDGEEKDQMIAQQDQLLREAQQDFQQTIDDLNNQKLKEEQNNCAQAYNVTGQLIEVQQRVQELERNNYEL